MISCQIFILFKILSIMYFSIIAEEHNSDCPIGFKLVNDVEERNICYWNIYPEYYNDKFYDYTGDLNEDFDLKQNEIEANKTLFWTAYKLNIDEYFNDLYIKEDEQNDKNSVVDNTKEMYVILDGIINFTAYKYCKTLSNWRDCIVTSYFEKSYSPENCEGFQQLINNRRETCLMELSGKVATWSEAKKICESKNAMLTTKIWRYSNFSSLNKSAVIPLGIIWDGKGKVFKYIADKNVTKLDATQLPLNLSEINSTVYLAINNTSILAVNDSYIFNNIICEWRIYTKEVTLNLSISASNQIILEVNSFVDQNNIHCYTDSVSYYLSNVKMDTGDNKIFILTPMGDGYYWCNYLDPRNSRAVITERVLYLRKHKNYDNLYVVKIRGIAKYSLKTISAAEIYWKNKLKGYIYNENRHGLLQTNDATVEDKEIMNDFNNSNLQWNAIDREVFDNFEIKRLYLDHLTVLLHINLYPDIYPVSRGTWDGIEIMYMKPAYYCRGFNLMPRLALGESRIIKLTKYHCVGNFNEGVEYEINDISNKILDSLSDLRKSLIINVFVGIRARVIKQKKDPDTSLTTTSNVTESDASWTDRPTTNEHRITNTPKVPEFLEVNQLGTKTTFEPSNSTISLSTPKMTGINVTITASTNTEFMMTSTINSTTSFENTPLFNASSEITDQSQKTDTTSSLDTNIATTPSLLSITETKSDSKFIETTPISILTLSPEDMITKVMEYLYEILQDPNLNIASVDNALDQVQELLELEEVVFPGEMLQLIDELGAQINLDGYPTGASVRDNVAILAADISKDNPVLGIEIARTDNNMFTKESLSFLFDDVETHDLDANVNEAVVILPPSVKTKQRRLSFVLFNNDRIFNYKRGLYTVNSYIISVNIMDFTKFDDGEVINLHLRPFNKNSNISERRSCAYWHFLEDESGIWSQDGCKLIKSNKAGLLDTCQCDHLTHFAEVLVPRPVFSQLNEDILEIISIIGCMLSIIGLLIIVLTAIQFKSWRKNFRNQIWLQLCVALFVMCMCFLVTVFSKFKYSGVLCIITGICLHYSILSSFFWMLIVAIISYRDLVLVFAKQVRRRLFISCICAWGLPLVIICILLLISPRSYDGRFEEKYPTSNFCYPSGVGLWLSVYSPIVCMLLANWALFLLTVYYIGLTPTNLRYQSAGDKRNALSCARVSVVLIFLFGLPWIFGLFAFNIVAAYLFTCTVTIQGFILFIFIVWGNMETRNLWLWKLKISRCCPTDVSKKGISNTPIFSTYASYDVK